MSITIQINPDLEQQLREMATKVGVDPSHYIIQMLKEQLKESAAPIAKNLPKEEAELLEKINLGISPETWTYYYELIDKRRAEKLEEGEQEKLIAISDQIEASNVERIKNLIALAKLRQVSLVVLMGQLGIQNPPYA